MTFMDCTIIAEADAMRAKFSNFFYRFRFVDIDVAIIFHWKILMKIVVKIMDVWNHGTCVDFPVTQDLRFIELIATNPTVLLLLATQIERVLDRMFDSMIIRITNFAENPNPCTFSWKRRIKRHRNIKRRSTFLNGIKIERNRIMCHSHFDFIIMNGLPHNIR